MKPVPYFIYAPVAFLLGVMIGVVALNINCPDCPPCEEKGFIRTLPCTLKVVASATDTLHEPVDSMRIGHWINGKLYWMTLDNYLEEE
jgi:hypothetical protein